MVLLYLNLFSYTSLVFSILNFLLSFLGPINLNDFIFPFLFLVSCLSLFFRNKNKILFYSSFLLFLIPISLFPLIIDKILLSIFSIYVFQLLYKDLTEANYSSMVDHFRKSVLITMIITFISIFLRRYPNFSIVEKFVIPYLLFNLIISVFLLRILRYLEYSPLDKKIISINIRYGIIILSLSLILSIPVIREALFTAVLETLRFLFMIFIAIIGVLFIIIGYVVQKIVRYIFIFLYSKGIIKGFPHDFELLNPQLKEIMKLFQNQREISSNFLNLLIFIIFSIFIISLTLFIIFRFLKTQGRNEKREEIYDEEKEFIFPEINLFEKIFKRKKNLDIVREYYRKYLLKSKEIGVEIEPSDTTYDIYEKTKNIFDSEILSNIRRIYILVRYHLEKSSSSLAEEFISLYKKIFKN